MVCKYSGGGDPCGMIVPMIEMIANVIKRNMVSLSEQKKSQRDWDFVFSSVVTITLLGCKFRQKCIIAGLNTLIMFQHSVVYVQEQFWGGTKMEK